MTKTPNPVARKPVVRTRKSKHGTTTTVILDVENDPFAARLFSSALRAGIVKFKVTK